jgi:hypothetical protein
MFEKSIVFSLFFSDLMLQQQQHQHQQHQPALLGSMEGYFTLSQQQPKQIFEEDFQKKKKKR